MTLEQQAQELQKLKGAALRARYREVVGSDTKSNNKPYLIRRIVQVSQSRSASSAPNSTPQATTAAPQAKRTGKRSDPRLPAVGTVLEREHDGRVIKVKVLEDSFQYENKTYRSLSAIAKEATGTVWNGWLFFNLIKRPAREASSAS